MVVCKCRKATKLYCFVHKVPVCGECICFPEHQICVVRSYSEWVIDGEYNWPPACGLCHSVFVDGSDTQTTRLGCLDLIHTKCLVSYLQSFPPHTAPAGYTCPSCSTSIWPPKSIKDSGSRLWSRLKEVIMQIGLEKNLFGSHPASLPLPESRLPPPAFASDHLVHVTGRGDKNKVDSLESIKAHHENYSSAAGIESSEHSATDIVEINESGLGPKFTKSESPAAPGATTRKASYPIDRQKSEASYYADDEDGNQKKYNRRGPFRNKFLKALLPFWSSSLPTLPVTAPPRKEDDVPEGRLRYQRSSRMDPRKILLIMAIMACMATMGILYYRLAQRNLAENLPDGEVQ